MAEDRTEEYAKYTEKQLMDIFKSIPMMQRKAK